MHGMPSHPLHRWYGGFTEQELLGDRLDLTQPVINITEPVGSVNDSNPKIAPFKIMAGVQEVGAEHKHLLFTHLFSRDKEDKTEFWKHRDWQKAVTDGMMATTKPWPHWGRLPGPCGVKTVPM